MSDFLKPADRHAAWMTVAAITFIQTSVVIAIALAAARVFKSCGPVVRTAILRGALATIVVCPLVSLGFHYAGISVLSVSTRPVEVSAVEINSGSTSPRAESTADGHDSQK